MALLRVCVIRVQVKTGLACLPRRHAFLLWGVRASERGGIEPQTGPPNHKCLGSGGKSWPINCDVAHHTFPRAGHSSDGARRIRTADLLGAIQALCQLSYSPEVRRWWDGVPVTLEGNCSRGWEGGGVAWSVAGGCVGRGEYPVLGDALDWKGRGAGVGGAGALCGQGRGVG